MKRFFILLTCFFLLITVTDQKVSAGGMGAICAGPCQSEGNAVLELVESVATTISGAGTALSVNIDMVKNTILDPIANGLISVALETTSDNVLSWVNGGMSGNPLIVSNPEDYIKKQGITEVRKALTALPQNGIYSDSIFRSLVDTYQDKSLKEKIAAEAKSTIPSAVQNNMCTDAMLTSLAKDRATNGDGVTDQAQAAVEKEYLYGYACSCDPNNDDDCASKLMDLYIQDPSLGGDEAWRQLTGGQNPWTKAQNVKAIVAEAKAIKEDLAVKNLYEGLGTLSETKCLQIEEDTAGNSYCAKEAVVNPGKTVQSALDLASTAGLQRLTNIMGDGALSSILTGFLQKSLFKGLNQGLASITGTSNSSQTTSSALPTRQDLSGDPVRKSELTGTIMKMFDFNKLTLSNIEKIDSDYTRDLLSYEPKVDQVKACFDSLVGRGMASAGDPRVSGAYGYYDNRKSRIAAIRNAIAADNSVIGRARDFITTTVNQMSASNSSQEISNIFNAYSEKYKQQGFPDSTYEANRKRDYITDNGDMRRDTDGDTHLNNCSQIEQQYWAAQYSGY